jgi:chaperonin GroES
MNDRVIVKRDEADSKTAGGIIIPDNAKEPVTRGVVLFTGPGKALPNGGRREPQIKVGDRVIFGKYSGFEFEQDNERRMVMNEDDIVGVVEEG